ncbi:hypothetical protein Tsubulata_806552 [Turnera subulata]|uniref:Alpha/beta hydrolase fold-3 domain-containing protein n=1 Tax=Turnera subulata TaxID=218843 RepID=A0A9Q0FW91_9ROSI|nr:hypothetical protein Tsubulata_806552 [Turnera subulata]
MDSTTKEIILDIFPYLRVYKDGTVERVAGTEVVPAGVDPKTDVLSKDIIIVPETNVSARLYRPNSINNNQKLPLLVYFHGGAFCIASAAEPSYHNSLNQLVSKANIIIVSVDYRLAPEHPLPAAYEDSWTALRWVASNAAAAENEGWLKDHADFDRVFLAGDSAGANIAHHMALRAKNPDPDRKLNLQGIILIHPYFWGKDPIGVESEDLRKALVESWWEFVCPSDKGCDDPYINPFVDGAPSFQGISCDKVLVCVAENDILSSRGKLYYESLVTSGWQGRAEIVETKGEDHVFHIFNPDCDNARALIQRWASFINEK